MSSNVKCVLAFAYPGLEHVLSMSKCFQITQNISTSFVRRFSCDFAIGIRIDVYTGCFIIKATNIF